MDADFSGAQVVAVHEVYAFSDAFIRGRATTEPLISRGQWLGALVRSDDVLGTLGVWRDGGGPPQPNGFSNDGDVGQALLTLTSGEKLVAHLPHSAYYAVHGTTVRPLNDWAERVLPGPADLFRLQEGVVDQYAGQGAQPTEGAADPPGPTIALVGMSLTLLVGGVFLRLRRRGPTAET